MCLCGDGNCAITPSGLRATWFSAPREFHFGVSMSAIPRQRFRVKRFRVSDSIPSNRRPISPCVLYIDMPVRSRPPRSASPSDSTARAA